MHSPIFEVHVADNVRLGKTMLDMSEVAFALIQVGRTEEAQPFLAAAQINRDEIDRRAYRDTGIDWGQWYLGLQGGMGR